MIDVIAGGEVLAIHYTGYFFSVLLSLFIIRYAGDVIDSRIKLVLVILASILLIGFILVVRRTGTPAPSLSPVPDMSVLPEATPLIDELSQEAVIDGVHAEFPDIHFYFGDIVRRTVTRIPSGYRMEAVARGTLESVTDAHFEDLVEEEWVIETPPALDNAIYHEFVVIRDGMRMHYSGQQINPDETSFTVELTR